MPRKYGRPTALPAGISSREWAASRGEAALAHELTSDVLEAMVLAVQTFSLLVRNGGDACTFVAWCHAVAGKPCPELPARPLREP